MMLLAGDIGGTKSWLAAFDAQQPEHIIAEQVYPSQQYDSLAAVVCAFVREFSLPAFSRACFGLPGPVRHGYASLTNLPWQVDGQQIMQQCGIGKVRLVNDFYAAAVGVERIDLKEQLCLQVGRLDPAGNRLVLGAGTGLGVTAVVNTGQGFVPQPCEGGHMDFAPVNELQQRVQKWLWQRWRHLSYERLLSGAGLQALYAFFSNLPLEQARHWPSAEQVQQWADAGETHAVKALHAFVQIYAAYIGNVALLWPSYAGIYIAGGIAAKIETWMSNENFLIKLRDKGRMSDLVASMPVYLIRDSALGLKGAMHCATKL